MSNSYGTTERGNDASDIFINAKLVNKYSKIWRKENEMSTVEN